MTTFSSVAQQGKLTFGLVFPIESYKGAVAKMQNQEHLAKRAEELGFKALWFRDVPFHDSSFGDAGQLYDPWVYMAHMLNHTKTIALASGSIILTLRHPAHTAKSLLSLQKLSNGRVLLGVASGDRPNEFPAFGKDILEKSELFRDSYFYLKALLTHYPNHQSIHYGEVHGNLDLLPRLEQEVPMLVTGHSGQSLEWIAQHADGWLYYPRDFRFLEQNLTNWKQALGNTNQDWKPYMQSLYLDLLEDDLASPKGIHLGFQSGADYAIQHLKELEQYGVNHVILNLKYGSRPAEIVLEEVGQKILPHFE